MTRKPKQRSTAKRRKQLREAWQRWYARKKAAREAKMLEPIEPEFELEQG